MWLEPQLSVYYRTWLLAEVPPYIYSVDVNHILVLQNCGEIYLRCGKKSPSILTLLYSMSLFIRIRYCSKFSKKNINSLVFESWKASIGALFCCKALGKWEECCRRTPFVCGSFSPHWSHLVTKCSSCKLLVTSCLAFPSNFGTCRLMHCSLVKFFENDFSK